MKKNIVWAFCAIALIVGCAGKSNSAASAPDSTQSIIDQQADLAAEGSMLPIFVGSLPNNSVIVYYWSDIPKPQKLQDTDEEYFEEVCKYWAMQEAFRKNSSAYTNLFMDGGKAVKVKFSKEQLKDPDGRDIEPGQIHFRPEIPNCGALLDVAEQGKEISANSCGVIVTDDYLKNHKPLAISDVAKAWNSSQLPKAVVKKLEQKYGMKAVSSPRLCQIEGGYSYGFVQFKGAWKNAPKDKDRPTQKHCLAVDVLTDGERVYLNERLGYYESETSFGWNVDDEGEYSGSPIIAAFEGKEGLTLCYYHSAPESLTNGIYITNNGQLAEKFSVMYQTMIDEEIPVWQKDIAAMQSIYISKDPDAHKGAKFKGWAHVYINYAQEWIWASDMNTLSSGAIFLRKDNKFKFIAEAGHNHLPSVAIKDDVGYLCIRGLADESSWYNEIYAFRQDKQIAHFYCVGKGEDLISCTLNGKFLSPEDGKAYRQQLPEFKDLDPYFNTIEN